MSLWKALTATYDGINFDKVRIDAGSNSLQVIDFEHHQVHNGSAFTCTHTQDVSDINDRTIISFLTPDTAKYLHITAAASATAVALASIIEAPTITDNEGDSLTVFNRRRVGSPTATTVWDTSTDGDTQGQATFFSIANMGEVTGGLLLASIPLGASTSPTKSIGGLARAQQEWILKPDTLYAFEVKSLDASNNTHWLELDWYEHTDIN